jgi:VanZ family protein
LKSRSWTRWLPVILTALVIFLLSSSSDPYGLLPKPVYQWIYLTHIWNIRLTKIVGPLAHMSAFGLLAFFLIRALGYKQSNAHKTLGLALVLTSLYALSDEFHQLFVPGRAFELLDLALDSLGGLVGILLWYFTHRPKGAETQDW